MLEMHVHELVERISGASPAPSRVRPGCGPALEAFFGFVEERRGAWRIMFRNAGDPDVARCGSSGCATRSPRRSSS